ncbi:MAG: LysR family transcriptional regulator [Acidimicrobiales bacterium]
MTLAQLRTLLAVADTGSVRGASERLFVSQPAVSGSVGALERELGVELVARNGRGLRFTPAGMAFVSAVRAGLAMLERGAREAQSIEEPGRGTVRIAAVTTAAERVLPPLLAAFRRSHPHAGLDVRVGNRTMVWGALRGGDVDLVVAGRPPAAMDAKTLGRAANRLVVVGSPPDTGSPPGLKELGRMTWLLREEGSGTRDAADEMLDNLGLDPPKLILGSNGAVEQGAVEGLGVALISLDAIWSALASRRLSIYQCRGTPLDRPWHLVTSAAIGLSPTAVLAARSMMLGPSGFTPTPDGRRIL